jgi:hypothetical protein
MPAAPAPLATAEVDVVIGVVQVDGVVAVDIIRRYHRRNLDITILISYTNFYII